MPTVIIDPGHGGMDPGAVYQGRLEKDDNLKLAMALGELLSDQGVDVLYTRTDDVYDSPYQKAVIANESDADYLISLHRNASAVPGNASGIQTLVYADRGLPAELARSINQELTALGFRDLGVIERPGLAVLRRSRMPAVLVETGFIDNDSDNQRFDSSFQEIAQAIANGILAVLPDQTNKSTPEPAASETRSSEKAAPLPEDAPPKDTRRQPPKLYRVQVGAFRNRNYAYELNEQLTEEGFPAFILMDGDWYRVQVGAFSRLENAIRMEYRLRAAGYDTYITT